MTWEGVLSNPADVKELIPEFFYNAGLLENSNNLDLGLKQKGGRIGNVVLPKWAKTPADFIRIHRKALESE